MVQIIAGSKGKGKTKILLDKVNTKVKESSGTIVYLDKNSKHMYELDRKVRLTNYNEFIGFLCGMISQDHDLETVYLDSFLSLACVENSDIDITPIIEKIDMISAKFNINFVISMSKDKSELTESVAQKVIVAL